MLAFAETRARALGRTCIRLYTGEPLTVNIAWYSDTATRTNAPKTWVTGVSCI